MQTERSTLFSTIKTYGFRSVFFRYIRSSMLTILLIFIPFCLIIATYYDYVLTKELSRQATINALQSRNIFEHLTEGFHMNYEVVNSSEIAASFLSEAEPGEASLARMQEFLQTLCGNNRYAEEMYLYSFASGQSVSSREIRLLSKKDTYEWHRTYMSTKLPFIMFPRQNEDGVFDSIYICNEIYSEQTLTGVFCIRMSYQQFEKIIQDSFVERPDHIFVVSEIGLILYSDMPELTNTLMFEKPDTYAAFQSAVNVEGNSIQYEDYIIAVAKSTQSRLLIMSYLEKDSIRANDMFVHILLFGSAAVVFLSSIILSVYLSLRQYRSVATVMQILDQPEKLHRQNGLLNEFFYIANSISDISRQKQDISNELSEKMYLLKSAQIAALQAQINPHFLFNTLQLINLSIIKEVRGDNLATQLISQLSSLVRIAYDTENYMVTVEKELETTQTYLHIQQARYKEQLHIRCDFEPDCLPCRTIKLILQPLVENSILHGLKAKEAPWHIWLGGRIEGEELVFTVSDNGTGIDPQTMQALNAVFAQNRIDRHEKVGISNVNQRLKLVYGRKCSMHIQTNETGGTTIEIRHVINNQL